MFFAKDPLDQLNQIKPLPNCQYSSEVRNQDLEFALAVDSNPNIIGQTQYFVRLLAHLPSYRKYEGQCIYWVARLNTGEFLLLEGGFDHAWTIDSWLSVLGRYRSKLRLIEAIPETDDFGRPLRLSLINQMQLNKEYGSIR